MNEIKLLAISGSLRQKSSNTALMNAIIGLAPENEKAVMFNNS